MLDGTISRVILLDLFKRDGMWTMVARNPRGGSGRSFWN
ncbi:unnamed protein product [Arabidopsis halleri]